MVREFWRHGSNAVLGGIVLLVLGLDVAGGWGALFWRGGVGGVVFIASEYGYPRYAFHAPPMHRVPWLRKMQHRLHYDHHVEPSRLDLLFLPIWFLVPNLAIAAALVALVFGWDGSMSALFGMMLAILHYEWVHYVAHIPYQPRSKFGRWIKQYHL